MVIRFSLKLMFVLLMFYDVVALFYNRFIYRKLCASNLTWDK
nr:MAG TPA: hypothetical protein [Caudoviricetes sp.]